MSLECALVIFFKHLTAEITLACVALYVVLEKSPNVSLRFLWITKKVNATILIKNLSFTIVEENKFRNTPHRLERPRKTDTAQQAPAVPSGVKPCWPGATNTTYLCKWGFRTARHGTARKFVSRLASAKSLLPANDCPTGQWWRWRTPWLKRPV